MKMHRLLQEHYIQYPLMTETDLLKLLYQEAYGPGHLVTDTEVFLERLENENDSFSRQECRTERIGSHFSRFYPNRLNQNQKKMILRMVQMSSDYVHDSEKLFAEGIELVCEEIRKGKLQLSEEMLRNQVLHWEKTGRQPFSHSERYRNAYQPHYRVMLDAFARNFSLFERVGEMLSEHADRMVVAIDGKCATGKSSLAELMARFFDGVVFHMDEFYLRKNQRTPERYREPGGNVDYERFQEEIFDHLSEDEIVYRPIDHETFEPGKEKHVQMKKLVIIEGAYSLNSYFGEPYDLKILLQEKFAERLERIEQRNGNKLLEEFKNRWIPLENLYFEKCEIHKHCDIILGGE